MPVFKKKPGQIDFVGAIFQKVYEEKKKKKEKKQSFFKKILKFLFS